MLLKEQSAIKIEARRMQTPPFDYLTMAVTPERQAIATDILIEGLRAAQKILPLPMEHFTCVDTATILKEERKFEILGGTRYLMNPGRIWLSVRQNSTPLYVFGWREFGLDVGGGLWARTHYRDKCFRTDINPYFSLGNIEECGFDGVLHELLRELRSI